MWLPTLISRSSNRYYVNQNKVEQAPDSGDSFGIQVAENSEFNQDSVQEPPPQAIARAKRSRRETQRALSSAINRDATTARDFRSSARRLIDDRCHTFLVARISFSRTSSRPDPEASSTDAKRAGRRRASAGRGADGLLVFPIFLSLSLSFSLRPTCVAVEQTEMNIGDELQNEASITTHVTLSRSLPFEGD